MQSMEVTTKWLWALIMSELMIPVVTLTSHSNTQKAGVMMCFTNIVSARADD